MGTRGVWGFHRDGKDKITYNHFDSYPECLGDTMLRFINGTSVEELNQIFDQIVLVKDTRIFKNNIGVDVDMSAGTQPTNDQVREVKEFFESQNINSSLSDITVSTGSDYEWYNLLRLSQGEPEFYKKGLKYMIDDKEFLKDSLFCEWGYIINLDTNVLEVYQGFQKEPNGNRYSVENPDDMEYYNCALILELSIEAIQELTRDYMFKTVVNQMNTAGGSDDE